MAKLSLLQKLHDEKTETELALLPFPRRSETNR